jgi:hypothetical protein
MRAARAGAARRSCSNQLERGPLKPGPLSSPIEYNNTTWMPCPTLLGPAKENFAIFRAFLGPRDWEPAKPGCRQEDGMYGLRVRRVTGGAGELNSVSGVADGRGHGVGSSGRLIRNPGRAAQPHGWVKRGPEQIDQTESLPPADPPERCRSPAPGPRKIREAPGTKDGSHPGSKCNCLNFQPGLSPSPSRKAGHSPCSSPLSGRAIGPPGAVRPLQDPMTDIRWRKVRREAVRLGVMKTSNRR